MTLRTCYYCKAGVGPMAEPVDICAACDRASIGDPRVVSGSIFTDVVTERNQMHDLLIRLGEACDDYIYWSERDTGGGAPDQYETMKKLVGEAHKYVTLLALRADAEIAAGNGSDGADDQSEGGRDA